MRNSFCDGFFKGCGIATGLAVACGIIWVGYNYLCKDLLDSSLAYFATKVMTVPNSNPTLDDATLYQVTLGYYNQVVSILIFIVGISGVIAFAHIGIISRDKAEEIARKSAENGVRTHIDSKVFHDLIINKIDMVINDGEFSKSGELLENMNIRLSKVESKYDRLDDKLQIQYENQLVEDQKASRESTG